MLVTGEQKGKGCAGVEHEVATVETEEPGMMKRGQPKAGC